MVRPRDEVAPAGAEGGASPPCETVRDREGAKRLERARGLMFADRVATGAGNAPLGPGFRRPFRPPAGHADCFAPGRMPEGDSKRWDDTSRVRVRQQVDAREARERIDEAIAVHGLGDHQRALDLLAPLARRTDAAGAEALWLMANCHAAEGRHDEAAGCLEWALLEAEVSELGRVALLYDLGAQREALGDLERAAECYRAVRRRAPWFRDVQDRVRRLARSA